MGKGNRWRSIYKRFPPICFHYCKRIIFDWSAHEGSYDMAEFAQGLLSRCIGGLL